MPSDSNDQSGDLSGKRRRSAFPRSPLSNVLGLIEKVHELGHGDPVRRRTVFEQLGRSPDSSTSRDLITAATGGYGVTEGGKNATHISLTSLGRRIAESGTRAERLARVHDVLFANSYFSAIVEKYSDRPLPNDAVAVDYLEREHGLSPTDAESLWTVAKQNMQDFGLLEDSGNKKIVVSREDAQVRIAGTPRTGRDADKASDTEEATKGKAEPFMPAVGARTSRSVTPQITFNVQVVLPNDASPEIYDAIFASMATHLLGRDEE